MIVLWKFPQISGIGVELRENRYELGLKSLEMNGLSSRFKLLSGDLRELKLDELFPLITSTPPYYTDSEGPISPHDDKSAARFELNGNIEDYFETADRHLSQKRNVHNSLSLSVQKESLCRIIKIQNVHKQKG
jgi:tRNA1Val (adenine37-N6)-methyltransferase